MYETYALDEAKVGLGTLYQSLRQEIEKNKGETLAITVGGKLTALSEGWEGEGPVAETKSTFPLPTLPLSPGNYTEDQEEEMFIQLLSLAAEKAAESTDHFYVQKVEEDWIKWLLRGEYGRFMSQPNFFMFCGKMLPAWNAENVKVSIF